jgi:hypothetical protein
MQGLQKGCCLFPDHAATKISAAIDLDYDVKDGEIIGILRCTDCLACKLQ